MADDVPVYIRVGTQTESYVGSIPRSLGTAGVSTFLRLLADQLDALAAIHAQDSAQDGAH